MLEITKTVAFYSIIFIENNKNFCAVIKIIFVFLPRLPKIPMYVHG